MKCLELKEHAWGYHAGRLSTEVRAECDAHVASCPDCSEYLSISAEISCEGVLDFIDAYIDGELESEQRSIFERHLTICPECVVYLDSYRKTRRLTKLQADCVPKDLPPKLLRAILDARDER